LFNGAVFEEEFMLHFVVEKSKIQISTKEGFLIVFFFHFHLQKQVAACFLQQA